MIYGLTGVHRCGKTFLAEQISEFYQIEFQPSVVGASFKQCGLKPDDILTWDERLFVQNTILDNMRDVLEVHKASGKDVIFDRTPIDFLGYISTTMIEVGGFDRRASANYIRKNAEIMDYFDNVLVVQPHEDIPFKDEPYKGRNEEQHMRILDVTMAMMGGMRGYLILDHAVSLDDRMYVAAKLLGIEK